MLDIYVLDSDGKEVKTWLTIIMDDYSRAIAGFLLSVEAPSSINTALALRQAISRKEEPWWGFVEYHRFSTLTMALISCLYIFNTYVSF